MESVQQLLLLRSGGGTGGGAIPGWVQGSYGAFGTLPGMAFNFDQGLAWRAGQPSGSPASMLTVSRNSQGYEDDWSGNWISFLPNTLRITNKGILVEEQRTNGIRNNSMQGVIPGTPGTLPTNWSYMNGPGTLSTSIVGAGTINGVDYVDIRLFGTSSQTVTRIAFDTAGPVMPASNGQTWTTSVFFQIVGGSLTNVSTFLTEFATYDSTVALLTIYSGNFTPSSSSFTRFAQTKTITDATAASVRASVEIDYIASAAIDITFRIGWPQCELGSFATSPIRTTVSAATRGQDVVLVQSTPKFGNGISLFGAGMPQVPTTASITQFIADIDDAGPNNRLILDRQNAGTASGASVSGGAVTFINGALWTTAASGKIAIATAAGDQAFSFNGGAILTGAGGLPVNLSVVRIGLNNGNGQPWDGYITNVAVWPTTRVPNSGLIAGTGQVTPPSWVQSSYGAFGQTPDLAFNFDQNLAWNGTTTVTPESLLTVTRASVAYQDDLAGQWYPFAANTLRQTNKGILVEEARTNSLRNNSAQGAVVGTPGTLPTNWATSAAPVGLSTQVVAIGTESGVDYIDLRMFGTTTATTNPSIYFEVNNNIPAANGQTWTSSLFVKIVAGTLANISATRLGVRYNDNTGATVQAADTPISILSGVALGSQRFSFSPVAAGATIAFSMPYLILLIGANGVAIDITFRIGWPQLELGSFATSPIRTTSAAVTRNGDNITAASPPSFGSSYSLFVNVPQPLQPPLSGAPAPYFLSVDSGSNATQAALFRAPLGVSAINCAGTTTGISAFTPPLRQAGAFAPNDVINYVNGTANGTITSAIPPSISAIHVGEVYSATGQYANAYISRAAIWKNVRLPNSALQAGTT